MAAQKGVTLKILIGDGATPTEAFTLLAGVQSKSLTIGGERIDITSDDDVNPSGVSRRTYLPGISDFGAQVSGILKNASSAQQLIADAEAGAIRNFQVVLDNVGTWEGPMFLSNLEFSGEFSGAVQFSGQLSANGAVTFTSA